jgi:hypothetical protein
MKERYELLQTKVSAWTSRMLEQLAKSRGITIYGLIQLVCQCLLRSMQGQHNKSPELESIMTRFHLESGWKDAYNMCDPTAKSEVAQEILILQQEGKRGFGAAMLTKPWMGEWEVTMCIDDILERSIEVTCPGIFWRLRQICRQLQFESFVDALIWLTEHNETIRALEDAERKEMEGVADFVDYEGMAPRQGGVAPTRKRWRRGMAELEGQGVLDFNEAEQHMAIHTQEEMEERERQAREASQYLREHSDFDPHGGEW